MIDEYDDKNRDETIEAVADFDGEALAEFLEYERDHKDRRTVLEPLERELVDVVPSDPSQQYVAGVWFDDPSEPVPVRLGSIRIETAIEAGDLEVLE